MQPQGVHSQTVNQVWNTVKARTEGTPASDHENRFSAALNLDKSWLNTPIHTHKQLPTWRRGLLHFKKQSHQLLQTCTERADLGKHRSQSTDPDPFKRNVLFSVRNVLSGLVCSSSSCCLLNLIWPQCDRPPCSSFPAPLLTDCFKCICVWALNTVFVCIWANT